MAIVADSLARAGASIRWVPSPQLPADGLSKAELFKTNGVLEQLIETGHFTLVQEQATIETAVGTTTSQNPNRICCRQARNESSRPEKEAVDDLPEDSADAMVSVESARKTCPLRLELCRMAGGSRGRWRYTIGARWKAILPRRSGPTRSGDHCSTGGRRRSDSALVNQRVQ